MAQQVNTLLALIPAASAVADAPDDHALHETARTIKRDLPTPPSQARCRTGEACESTRQTSRPPAGTATNGRRHDRARQIVPRLLASHPAVAGFTLPGLRHEREAKRPNARARGYDKRWEQTRARFLELFPTCRGCGGKATEVDHLDGLGPNGPAGHDPGNLRSTARVPLATHRPRPTRRLASGRSMSMYSREYTERGAEGP